MYYWVVGERLATKIMWKKIDKSIEKCTLCNKDYKQYESNKMWRHCIPCLQIISKYGYYDINSELKISETGLNKLNKK